MEWVSETTNRLPVWVVEHRIRTGEERGRINDLDLPDDIKYLTFDITRKQRQKYVRAFKQLIDIPNIRKIFNKMPNYLRERFIKGSLNVIDEENLAKLLKVDKKTIQDIL